ncbi:MAG: hypothetical protein HON90_11675 [Halobacteriovoraceae bacterium]|nr:hypothetical protein [Halobacteriovoraceae bacterium]
MRQSLEEITDVYMTQKMSNEHKKLPSKIILCYGGEMRQEVQPNWTGFTNKYSDYTFEDWGGNRLSGLIETYLTDEHLFFEDVKKDIRRTIVFLSDSDYKLTHYKEMLKKLLDKSIWKGKSQSVKEKDALKVLNMISLCMGMINQYSIEAENLEHSLNSSELSLLFSWAFISENNLEENKKILDKFYQMQMLHSVFAAGYFNKLEKYFYMRDGICSQGRDSLTSSLVTFKIIGILASVSLNNTLFALAIKDKNGIENSKIITNALACVIKNNSISASPCYDGQTIDICLAIYSLALVGKIEEIKEWIKELIHRFHFSYKILDKNFPIAYDSIDMLMEFEFEGKHSKEKMAGMSTLIPTLAYWCAILDFKDEYSDVLKLVEELKETDLQLWYPRKGIKQQLYKQYAGNEFGIAEVPLFLPESIEELKLRIKTFLKFSEGNNEFETKWDDSPPGLPLMASRQFRTPANPFYWLSIVKADVSWDANGSK